MSVLRMKSPALILPALFLLAASGPAKAQSGTGAASFGTVAIGQAGSTQPVTLTFSSAGTVSTQRALTDGAEKQDFAIVSGGSCSTGQSYPAGGSCTVSVTFAPIYPGLRRGAVVLEDASGEVLASSYVYGAGSGPEAGFQALDMPLVILSKLGIVTDKGIAVDGNGNLFVSSVNAATQKESLVEIPAGCAQASCLKQLPGVYYAVWGLAVDGAGNLWVGDFGANGTITEILAAGGYSTLKTHSGDFGSQIGVAVDGGGNVYIISGRAGYADSVVELTAASGYTAAQTLAANINIPGGVAVDASGNVFYVDEWVAGIQEIAAVNGTIPATPTINTVAKGLKGPLYLAVDGGGNLIVTANGGFIYEVPAEGGYATVNLYSNQLEGPTGVVIDGGGNLYINNYQPPNPDLGIVATGDVCEIARSAVPLLVFGTITAPGEIDTGDGPQKVSLQNQGNEPLVLTGLAMSNQNFTLDQATTTCTSTITLAPGEDCILSVLFTPKMTGSPITGNLTFTDNSLNAAAVQQSLSFSGNGLYTPTIHVTSTAPLTGNSWLIVRSQDLTLTITINGGSGNPTPTGSVQVSANGYSGSPVTLTNGSAAVTIPGGSLNLGQDTLTFQYQPDTAGASSYVPVQGQGAVMVTNTLMNLPLISVTPAVTSISVGQALTVVVTVSPASGAPTPTGTVTLAGGNYSVPATPLLGGSASFTIPANSLLIGIDVLTSYYTPDSASSAIYIADRGTGFVLVSAAPPPAGAAAADFGSLAIGKTSAVTPVTLSFPTGATPASLIATTQGASGLDFAIVDGGGCGVGVFVARGQSCTVDVTFTPGFAGLRSGAVVALDDNGQILAMTYIHGVGTGAKLNITSTRSYWAQYENQYPPSFGASSTTELSDGFARPIVTVDGAGNVYVADWGNNRVQKIPAGCTQASCSVTVMSGLFAPSAVAVDGAGNLFVTEAGLGDVKKIPLGCQSASCMQTIGTGFNGPYGLFVDAGGNVFVADTNNNAIKEVVAADGYATIDTLATGLDWPWSVVVNAAGDLFVAEGGDQCHQWIPGECSTINTSVVQIPAAGGYKTVNTLGSGSFGKPLGVAIDSVGNLYESDFGNGCAGEWTAGSGYATTENWCTPFMFLGSEEIGVESNGDLIFGDVISGEVYQTEYHTQPAILFRTAIPKGTTDNQDGTQSIFLMNNGNAPLTLSGMILSDPSIQFNATYTTCSTSKPLPAGGTCFIAVDFVPIATGPHNSTLTINGNDTNLNITQIVPITAIALPPAPVILTYPANPTTTNSAAFTFSDTQSPVTFVCSIDALPFAACSSPLNYSALSAGTHGFQVKAVDTNGNLSLPAFYNWTVNTVGPPAPVITSTPSPVAASASAVFTFTDAQAGVTFLCSLDGAAFSACTSGVSYTVTGNSNYPVMNYHSFAVEARDGAGNVSPETTLTWAYEPTPANGQGAGVNFGDLPVGQTSAPVTVTFLITTAIVSNEYLSADTVATIDATTMGITGLDFAVSDPGTCAVGNTLSRAASCTLKATFSPKYAGQRRGAVVLLDATGNAMGVAYLEGVGTAPQVTFSPYTAVMYNILSPQNNPDPGKDLYAPVSAIAVDGAGNLYVSDYLIGSEDQTVVVSLGDLWKFAPGCTSYTCDKNVATLLPSGLATSVFVPAGIAMDGAGLIWIANSELWTNEFATVGNAGSQQCWYPTYGFARDQDVTADGAGISSIVGNGYLQVCGVQVGVNSSSAAAAKNKASAQARAPWRPDAVGGGGDPGPSFDFSSNTPALTVDPQGNLFVADAGNNAIKEVLASSNYTISRVVGSGFNNPTGVASDAFGNIYVSDTGNGALKEMTASSGYTQILTIAAPDPKAIGLAHLTLDALGNIYLANTANSTTNQMAKLDFADAPTLTFATATKVGTTDTTDGTLTATVKNNGNAPLVIGGLALSNANFLIDAGATTCSSSTPLAAGASCTIGVLFTPTAAGALTGTLTLTDNALNATSATQAFALSGTAFTKPTTTTPTVVATPAGTTITTAQSDVVVVTVAGTSGHPVPTGNITLSGGSYTAASVALNNGAASLSIPPGALAVGTNTLTAVYSPDAASIDTYGAASGSTSITVTAGPRTTPTLGVTPSLLDVSTRQSLSVTITVSGASDGPLPTGSVTLSGGNYGSQAVTLTNGSASVTIPSGYLPSGMDILTALYMPDAAGSANFNSASGSGQVNVEAAPLVTPAVTLTPASNSIPATQTLAVTVQVSGGSGNPVPTGSVVLSAGSYSSIAAPISQGSVILAIPAGTLSGGSNTLTAAYAPDKASALTYSSATGAGAVTATAPQSINFAQPSSPVTYSPSLTIPLSATGGASGNPVVFTLDASSTGMGAISSAMLTVTGAGTFLIDANQAGNTNYSVALQVQRTVVVAQATQTIDFAQPGSPVNYSQGLAIPLSATGGASGNAVVFSIDASSTGTGSITGSTLTVATAGTFVVNANQAGNTNYSSAPRVQRTVVVTQATQTINFSPPTSPLIYTPSLAIQLSATGGASANPVVFTLDATSTGTGSISSSSLNVTSAGTFVIDANQGGNSTYSPAPQVQRTVVVTPATQTINFAQPTSPVDYSQGLTIPLSATGGASGNAVIFSIDASSSGTGSISGGTLSVTAAGTFVIDANQAGNGDYAAAPQVRQTVVVNPSASDFTLTMAPAALTIPPGGSGGFTVTAASINGSFSSPVNLSVTGLPVGVTGSFSPASITPGSSNATSTLTVHASNMTAVSRSRYWPLATTSLAVLVLLPMRFRRRIWARRMLLSIVGLAFAACINALSGCGGGFGLVPPPATYTVTITGTSGADIHSTTVKLTVQ